MQEKNLSNKLLEYRKKYNISQQELAKKLNTSQQNISRMERGYANTVSVRITELITEMESSVEAQARIKKLEDKIREMRKIINHLSKKK